MIGLPWNATADPIILTLGLPMITKPLPAVLRLTTSFEERVT
jgi:hypothetical protein